MCGIGVGNTRGSTRTATMRYVRRWPSPMRLAPRWCWHISPLSAGARRSSATWRPRAVCPVGPGLRSARVSRPRPQHGAVWWSRSIRAIPRRQVPAAGTRRATPTVRVVASYTVPVAARCMPASMRPTLSRPRTMPASGHLGLAGALATRLALRVVVRPLEGPRATPATRRLLALAVVDTALHQERDPDHAHEPVI